MKAANTLVILSDEHQARALSIAGHALVKTPNLDRLAARGMRFTNAVTPCPICVPARAAFATGLPVHECRYWANSFGYDGHVVPASPTNTILGIVVEQKRGARQLQAGQHLAAHADLGALRSHEKR